MKRFISTKLISTFLMLALALLLPSAVACANRAASGDKLDVSVSILPLQEFVEQVGGAQVQINVMVPPGANPHTYEVKPSQMAALSRARMYAKVGTPIEFELAWMDRIIAANRQMLIVDCSSGIEPVASTEEGEAYDPHTWSSLVNAQVMVRHIAGGLIQVDPANKSLYEQNRDAYVQQLAQLDSETRTSLANVRNRRFIIYHPGLGYMARDYNLEEIAIEQEGREPTASYIARLIDEAKSQNIRVIFASPEFSTRSAELIAQEIGGKVVIIDPLAKDYLKSMRDIAQALREAME